MSKLSKHNRYQKGKPAPVKALPAIGAIVAKVAPVVKGLVAKGSASGAASGGGKGEVVKNLIKNFSNKRKSNTEETAQEKDYYADQSGGDFSHLNSMAPFAMNSPFKKKPGSNNDAVSVTSSVKGVSNQQTGTYDVEARDITLVAGSSGDPLAGKGNTAEDAISASGEIDGTKITTTETPTSLAQQKNNQTTVNPSTGNVVSNNSKPSSNPNTAEAAINESSGSKKPVIGNETRLGSMHNKHYWEKNKRGKYVKRNDNLWVRERPKEGGPTEVTYTNPFNEKPAAKPDVKGGVKADLNKKANIPTDMSYRPAESFGNPSAKTAWSKAGLNEMQEYAKASKKEGDEAGYKHYTNIINNTRLDLGLNKTRKTDVSSSSALGNSADLKNASLHTNRSKPLSGSAKPSSSIKGNTSNKATSGKPEIITNKNGTFRRVKGADNVVTSFEKISPPDTSKKLNVQSKLSKDLGTTSTTNITSGQGAQFDTNKKRDIVGSSSVKAETKSSTYSSPKQTGGKAVKKVKKDIFKENKKSDKQNKRNKSPKTKNNRRRGGNGLVKAGKNPLFGTKK